jgi:hypothetical protein
MGVVFEMLHFHGVALAMFAWKKMLGICTNFDPKKRYKSINGLAKAIRRIRLLQNYQWYGFGCLFCMVFLIGMCARWMMKPMDDKGKQADTQVIMTTQGSIETDISESESQESTETDISDSEEQESTDTSMPELYDEADEETLTAIKNMLETQSLYVSEYFKCEKNVDYFMYSDFFENDIEVRDATLIDLVSKEYVNLKDDLRIENANIETFLL